jgi:hypothetical protein
MPTLLQLSTLEEFVQAGSAGIRSESLQASVPYDSECESTDYYEESDFGDTDIVQRRPSTSEQLDSDATVPYDDSSSFELSRSFLEQQSCDIYLVKVANESMKGEEGNIVSIFCRNNREPKNRESRSTIRKYLRYKRKQAAVPSKAL